MEHRIRERVPVFPSPYVTLELVVLEVSQGYILSSRETVFHLGDCGGTMRSHGIIR